MRNKKESKEKELFFSFLLNLSLEILVIEGIKSNFFC